MSTKIQWNEFGRNLLDFGYHVDDGISDSVQALGVVIHSMSDGVHLGCAVVTVFDWS